MRSHPADFHMIAPGNLQAVVSLLAKEPGAWVPVAGGTDLMVQYAAGKLPARKLVSIWNLPELRRIDSDRNELKVGAGCTYTDIATHELVLSEFSLLHRAARWTGGVANQNRGTIGGNIVNASPAADSLPALLVYDAELVLVSVRGERRLPYARFHSGYKKTQIAPDELILSICLPRNRFAGYVGYSRKVGARNSQAISKLCIAALARVTQNGIEDIRIALGSVAPIPLRLTKTEQTLSGKEIDSGLLLKARKSVADEIEPINDIRSTARYRAAVAGNLLVEFLQRLTSRSATSGNLSRVLQDWNLFSPDEAAQAILPCCGSTRWAQQMAARRPLADETALLAASNDIWHTLSGSDWLEAFASHPRIGERRPSESSTKPAPTSSEEWSSQEQSDVARADALIKAELASANQEYERRFRRIFIVCATHKSAEEILRILRRRLLNDDDAELREAAEQQRQITEIRLRKWLQS